MKNQESKNTGLHRRKFLGMTGALAAVLANVPSLVKSQPKTDDNIPETDNPYEIELPQNKAAEILKTEVICRQPGKYVGDGTVYDVTANIHPKIVKKVLEADRYMGWATLTQTHKGELIVAFSGDRDSHVCPWGKTQLIRSTDQGKTWSEPETVNNTPLDDRDAGILQTKSGALVVNWFTSVAFTLPVYKWAFERYARITEKLSPEVKEKWLGNWSRRSEDNGKTWQEPARMACSSPHGAIQLQDGRLLCIGNGAVKGKPALIAEHSKDDGRSWSVLTTIAKPAGMLNEPGEPHVIQLSSGKIIAMFRNEPKDRSQCFLLQSDSTDGGKTWTPLKSTGIWGYPPHLIQLKNGWVLMSYGYRREPFGQRACISKDDGKTWDIANEIVFANSPGPDMGYPSSTELIDGSIMTTYYQAERPGGPAVIWGTHWKLT